MANFIRLLLRHRALACIAIALSLVAALYASRNIALRFQYRDFYDYPGSPGLALFQRDNSLFSDAAGYVVAMVQADDVFRRDVLAYVDRITEALRPQPEFARIRSLTNVNMVRGKGDQVLTGRLMADIPETPEAIAELKGFVLGSPLLRRRLISPDATTTAVLAEMRVPVAFATVPEQQQAATAMQRVLDKYPPPAGVRVTLTGAPKIEIDTTVSLINDLLVLVPAALLVLCLMLFVTFRSLHGVLLGVSSVSVATIWTAGIFAAFERPIDLMGSVMPPILLVYGVVDPIFVLARFLGKIDAGRAKHDAIVEALSELALPCFLTSLTTGIGFAAFVTGTSPSVRYFGLTVGIGVLLAFVTTVTVLPLLLSLAPLPKRQLVNTGVSRYIDATLSALGRLVAKRSGSLILLACALLAAAGFLGRIQHVRNAYVGTLPEGKSQNDVRLLEQKLAGVIRVSVLLEGAADTMKRPDVLAAIQSVDRALERDPHVTFSGSLADLVGEAHLAFQGGDAAGASEPARREVPRSPALVAQYLALIDPLDRAEFVTDDFSRSHIAILLEDQGSEATRAFAREVERAVQAAGFSQLGVQASVTGHGVIAYHALDEAVMELLLGFVVAFLAVIVFEWLLFRSWRAALLTVIPNLVPVAACFIATRSLEIPLRIDTVLVLCVCIGGLFNTTIHFVARVRQLTAAGETDPDAIVTAAMRTIGPPSLFTAIILSFGFAVFLLSSFSGLHAFGLLSMITIVVGFVSDMVFTPALFRLGFDWQSAFREHEQKEAVQVAFT